MLPVCSRRATLTSLHPWRGAFTGRHALEWCPQKTVPVPGAQLCSWNTCRELYRHVGNFVGSVNSLLLAKTLAKFAAHLVQALAAVSGEPMDLPQGLRPMTFRKGLEVPYNDNWMAVGRNKAENMVQGRQ